MGTFKSEAERQLDYEIMPDSKLRKKVKVLISPYNKTLIHQKHMSFDYDAPKNILYADAEQENLCWRRLSELILKEDKIEMRKFLAHLNNKFYKQLEQRALSEAKRLNKAKKSTNAGKMQASAKIMMSNRNSALPMNLVGKIDFSNMMPKK